MIKEYLEVNRPDKRHCDGCSCLRLFLNRSLCICKNLGARFEVINNRILTPPNCPLVKVDSNRRDNNSDKEQEIMKEYIKVERVVEDRCLGCHGMTLNENRDGWICGVTNTPLDDNQKTPSNCPLVKLGVDWGDKDSHTIDDPRWAPCSVKEANEKAINTRFNTKYVSMDEGLK